MYFQVNVKLGISGRFELIPNTVFRVPMLRECEKVTFVRTYLETRRELAGGSSSDVTDEQVNKLLDMCRPSEMVGHKLTTGKVVSKLCD